MTTVFIVSELFYPNKTSTAYIMTEIAKGLTESYRVSVICTDVVYDSNISKDCSCEIDDLKVYRTKNLKLNKNKYLSRIFSSIYNTFSLAYEVVKRSRTTDRIFAVTNPFPLVVLLAILRKFKKWQYALLVHDIFPENAVPAALLRKRSFLYKVLKLIYDWSYSQADKIVTLGIDMKDILTKKGVVPEKIFVIPNWFDDDIDVPDAIDRNQYLGQDVSDKFIIGFSGNIGRVQALGEFLNVFSTACNKQLLFVIVGDGAYLPDLLKQINERKLNNNVIYLGAKPRNEQKHFLNICDIGLVTLASGMYGLGVPSKSYNLLALGKPLLYIGDTDTEISILIKQHTCGWQFNWENTLSIVEFLNSLPLDIHDMSESAKRVARQHHKKEHILKRIAETIRV